MNRTRLDYGLCPYITGGFIPELADTTPHWVNACLNIPFALTATLGNALIIWTIFRTKSLHTPSNLLLCGLASSDFFAGFFVQPLYSAFQVAELTSSSLSSFCYVGIAFNVASRFVACTSLITLAAVSLERYVALRLHLRYKDIITIKRVFIFLVSVWILSAFVSATWLIYRSVTSLMVVILLTACFGISVSSCFKISVILRRHLCQIEQCSAHLEVLNWRHDETLAVVTLFLNCVFFLCFLPHACTVIIIRSTGWSSSRLVALNFTCTLALINSTLDPLIFCWRVKQIRAAVIQSICDLFSRSED